MTRRYAVATAPLRTSKHWRQDEATWQEVVGWTDHPATHKECGNYMCGRLEPTQQDDHGGPGGCFGLHRTNEGIFTRSMAAMDADKATAALPGRVEALGCRALAHTTYSSRPDALRLRLLFPTDRDMLPEEYRRVVEVLMERLGREQFDRGSAEPARFMFKPSAADPDEFQRWVWDGEPLAVDELLREYDELWPAGSSEPERAEATPAGPPPELDELPSPVYVQQAVAGALADLGALATMPDGEDTTLGGVLKREAGWDTAVYVLACRLVKAANSRSGYTLADAERDFYTHAPAAEGTYDPAHKWRSARQDVGGQPLRPAGEGSGGAGSAADLSDVFEATETLSHLRRAAYARLVSSHGLLVCVLGRVLAEVPWRVYLPPVIGSRAALNLGVLINGGSGSGKSTLIDVSREVLGEVGEFQADLERNVGSGEGIVQTFLRWNRQSKANEMIDHPYRIIMVDEVDQLTATQNRSGATLAPIIRSALTGGALGQENAHSENRRHVPARSYRLVMFIGVQPTRAEALLRDSDAGTPQRFVWVSAADETIPDEDVAWPGALDWHPPADLSTLKAIAYPDHIKEEIRAVARRKARARRDPAGAARAGLEGHKNLVRLKVAAGFALLHGETAITDQWWALAGRVVEMSMTEQDYCRAVLAEATAAERRNLGQLDGIRQEGAAGYHGERAAKAAASIWRKVHQHATSSKDGNDQRHEPDEGCTARCLGRALRDYPDRAELRAAALEHAADSDWIEERSERWFPGQSRPAT